MNNNLSALPFEQDISQLNSCDCRGQSFDPAGFKLYSELNRLPPFYLRFPRLDDEDATTYGGLCVDVLSCDGLSTAASLTMEQAGVVLFTDEASWYLVYDGSPIAGLLLNCGECFRIKVSSYYSESFWTTDNPKTKLRLRFANKFQLGDVPYQTGFRQELLIDGDMCNMDADIFENRKTENNGKEVITYQKLTRRKGVDLYNAPSFVQNLIGAVSFHDYFSAEAKAGEILSLVKGSKVTATALNCCEADINIVIPIEAIEVQGGVCQTNTSQELTIVDIPEDLPDDCETEDVWTPTDEILCLKLNETPPPINNPVTPVGTPPPATCPPDGRVITSVNQTVDCSNAWVQGGIKYKTRIEKTVANGDCTTRTEYAYAYPCNTDAYQHTVTDGTCEDVVTPPVGTPPVGPPPVGTPPVGTPPPSLPSVFSKYRYVLGTTGYGFDPSATHGIANEWVERIDAYNYSWGYGINGISLWVPWETWEPTSGNYQVAGMQKVINFCNARGLDLEIVFLARRRKLDGFLLASELVKGSNGTEYFEGVPIDEYKQVYPSYGCPRVLNLIRLAIIALTNVVKTYSKAGSISPGGGNTGELINHGFDNGAGGDREMGDFCDDNLSRFNSWLTARGFTPGAPPIVQGPGIFWPHPDFTQTRGKEFYRFMNYNIAKYFKTVADAVKSVSNLSTLYFYAHSDSYLQFGTNCNASMDYIVQYGDGMYGSDGDGLDHTPKIRCNSINIGTKPSGISCAEFDPMDMSPWQQNGNAGIPPYCNGGLQYGAVKGSMETLYSKGALTVYTAMSKCPSEIAAEEQMCVQLNQSYIRKPYVRPTLNATNLVVVDSLQRTFDSINATTGIDTNSKYVQYQTDLSGGITIPTV